MNQLIDNRRFIHVCKVLCSQLFKALNADRQFISLSFSHFLFLIRVKGSESPDHGNITLLQWHLKISFN